MPRVPIPGDNEVNRQFLEQIRARLSNTGCVRLIQAYDQTDDSRLEQSDLTTDGWCLAMVLYWLERHKNRVGAFGEFWDYFMAPEAPAKLRFFMAAQRNSNNLTHALLREEALVSSLEKIMATRRLFYLGRSLTKGFDGAQVIFECVSPYSLIVAFGKTGAHAFGVRVTREQEYYFLDPNYGEIWVHSRPWFFRWMHAFFGATDYIREYQHYFVINFA